MNNVFVLCTGRCGSTTFIRAAEHIENYSAAHESRPHVIGPSRLDYPPDHIEADNRLSWLLGRLDREYGDRARYVHLIRDPEAVAASLARRTERGIMSAYQGHILMRGFKRNPGATALDFAHDYIDTVTENIRLFLRDKSQVMTFHVEKAATDFPRFWEWIGAEGDRAAGAAEWTIRHNASE